MEQPWTRQVPTLPYGTPEEVRLVGQDWLSEQTADGATLMLEEQHARDAQEDRLRDLQATLHNTQLQVSQLQYALMLAERPLWKKLFSRT